MKHSNINVNFYNEPTQERPLLYTLNTHKILKEKKNESSLNNLLLQYMAFS